MNKTCKLCVKHYRIKQAIKETYNGMTAGPIVSMVLVILLLSTGQPMYDNTVIIFTIRY